MATFLLVLLLVPFFRAGPVGEPSFQQWKEQYAKVYLKSGEEETRRRIYTDNVQYIEEYNAAHYQEGGVEGTRLHINQYADLTHQEFLARMTGPQQDSTNHTSHSVSGEEEDTVAPDSIDWRREGAVSKVMNQRSCNCGYAFAAAGAVEGQWALRKGTLIPLSEQQIVDCSRGEGNAGCSGGLTTRAFDHIIRRGGIDTEASYPFAAKEGDCRFSTKSVAAKVTGYKKLYRGNESQLKKTVGTAGPVAVVIDASHRSLQFYSGGIYYDAACSPYAVDHAVLVVGYGTTQSRDYWLIKNSWGTDWGEEGYLKLLRNYYNHCGVATMASIPTV